MFKLGSLNFFTVEQGSTGGGAGAPVIRFSFGTPDFCNTNQTEIKWSYAFPIYW